MVYVVAIMVICLVTNVGLMYGFAADRHLANSVHHARAQEGTWTQEDARAQEGTWTQEGARTQEGIAPLVAQIHHDQTKNSENKRETLTDILQLAYDVLQEEESKLGNIVDTVKAIGVSDMRRIQDVTDLIEEYVMGANTASITDEVVEYSRDSTPAYRPSRTKRRHRKRSTFDSISHNGGMGGLGQAESERRRGKLAFTFQILLPYLLNEQRRNNRAVVRRTVGVRI